MRGVSGLFVVMATRQASLVGGLTELRDDLGDSLVVAQFAAPDSVEQITRARRNLVAGQPARRHSDGHRLALGGRTPGRVQLQYSGIRSSLSR